MSSGSVGLKVTFWDESPLLLFSEAQLPIAQLVRAKVFNCLVIQNIFFEKYLFSWNWEIFFCEIFLPCLRRGGSFPVLFWSCSCPTCWLRVSSDKLSSGPAWSGRSCWTPPPWAPSSPPPTSGRATDLADRFEICKGGKRQSVIVTIGSLYWSQRLPTSFMKAYGSGCIW